MTTFKDILNQVIFDDVKNIILENYPDEENQIEEYKKVFFKLLQMVANPNKEKWKLVLEKVHEEWDFEDEDTGKVEHVIDDYINVYGKKSGKKQAYAIEYSPWTEWLSLTIESQTIKDFSAAEIVAHALYEMTYVSFNEEDIIDTFNMIMDRYSEVKESIEKSIEKSDGPGQIISLEEAKQKIEKKK